MQQRYNRSPSRIKRAGSHAVSFALAFAIFACADTTSPTNVEQISGSPLRLEKSTRSEKIPDEYIVVFKDTEDDVAARTDALLKKNGGKLRHTYRKALKGFAATMTAETAARMSADPSVDYVEQDETMDISTTQSGATWGIDRIDQATLPLNGTYTYTNTGAGVHAYIIDTGILTTHVEFAGRASGDFSSIADQYGATGCHWHGTHVAGTVGGNTVGVAKQVRLHSVRVLDCNGSGSTSGVIAGIDWVTANRVLPAVANMSLGGGFTQALNDAVQRSISSGVTYVLSAGNSAADACQYSPSSTPAALTVGATTSADKQSGYSNFGTCVDIYAPGDAIYSSMSGGGYGLSSGTSMAAPHVTGAVALYLQGNPSATTATVAQAIISQATPNVLTGLGAGSPNRLVRTSTTTVSPPPAPDAPPVANFSWVCSGLTCTLDGRSSTDNAQIVSYEWNLGKYPGTMASGAVVSATYPHTGQRTVVLTVKDNAGQTNSITKIITIGGTPPSAKFTSTCSGSSCAFDASTSTSTNGISSYSWNFGDGASGSGIQTSHSYAAGTYVVTLTVTDAAGMTSSSSGSVTIAPPPTTNNPPVASFTVSCSNLSCALDGRSSTDDGSITKWSWSLGKYPDGSATGSYVVTSYPHIGDRTVTLTVTDNTGKTASITRTFTVK